MNKANAKKAGVRAYRESVGLRLRGRHQLTYRSKNMYYLEDNEGDSKSHIWWRNHSDRRYFTILGRSDNDGDSFLSVMDEFGNLVSV